MNSKKLSIHFDLHSKIKSGRWSNVDAFCLREIPIGLNNESKSGRFTENDSFQERCFENPVANQEFIKNCDSFSSGFQSYVFISFEITGC